MTKKTSSSSTSNTTAATTSKATTTSSSTSSSFVILGDSALETLGLKGNKSEQFNAALKMFEETTDKTDRETLVVLLGTLVTDDNLDTLIAKIKSANNNTANDIIKQLVSVFNLITSGQQKTKLFTTIIQYMLQNDEVVGSLNISPIVDNIESAFTEWSISSKKDKQSILMDLSKLCVKLSKINEAFDLVIKSLKSGADESDKKELVNLFIRFPFEKSAEELKEFEPEVFGAVLSYLEQDDEAVPETLKQKISQYEKTESVISQFVSDLKVLKFLVSCSVKILTSKKDIELKYSDIEKLTPNGEVELFVCEMMGRNLIECKMNQLEQSITVQAINCRGAAHKQDWKNIESLVSAWSSKLATVLTSLTTEVNPQQFKNEVKQQQHQQHQQQQQQ